MASGEVAAIKPSLAAIHHQLCAGLLPTPQHIHPLVLYQERDPGRGVAGAHAGLFWPRRLQPRTSCQFPTLQLKWFDGWDMVELVLRKFLDDHVV